VNDDDNGEMDSSGNETDHSSGEEDEDELSKKCSTLAAQLSMEL
jgi:hypothetical protein